MGVFCLVVSVFFLFAQEGGVQPKIEYSDISLDSENKVLEYPLSFEFSEDKFYAGKIKVSVDVNNSGDSKVIENVQIFVRDSETDENYGELGKSRTVELSPWETRTENFVIHEETEDDYVIRVDGISKSFQVRETSDNPSFYSEHYYAVAENYVPEAYNLPENKDIEGLVDFLNQIEMPPYQSGNFSSSHSSVMLEWLLEGAGFDTEIVVNEPEVISDEIFQIGEEESGDIWVLVNVENREIAIESVLLGSQSWVGQSESYKRRVYYEPPGIVETSDNYFRKNSIQLPEFTDTYSAYYYWEGYKRYKSAEEFQKDLSYVGKFDLDWWGRALVSSQIKSSLPEVEPFSTWVFG